MSRNHSNLDAEGSGLNPVEKEVEKAKSRFGASFDEKLYRETNPRVVEYAQKAQSILDRMNTAMSANDMDSLKNLYGT